MSSRRFPNLTAATTKNQKMRRNTYRQVPYLKERIIPSNTMPAMPDLDQIFDDHMKTSSRQEAVANNMLLQYVDQHHTNSQTDDDIVQAGHEHTTDTNSTQERRTCSLSAAAINFNDEVRSDKDELDDICSGMLGNNTAHRFDHAVEDIPQDDAPGVHTTPSLHDLLRQIRQDIRYVVSWDRILSYLSLNGRVTFTKHHYAVMAAAVNTALDEKKTLNH